MWTRARGFVRSSLILLIVALVWAGGVVLLHLMYIRPHLERQTQRIRQRVVSDWIRLSEYFLRAEGNRILMLTTGWSTRPEIRQYIDGGKVSDAKNKLSDVSFHAKGVSAVVLCDAEKKVVAAWGKKDGKFVRSDLFKPHEDISRSVLFRVYSNREDVFGIGKTPLGLALFARCAIRQDDGRKIGYIVAIRPMDASFFTEISAVIGAKVEVVSAYELPKEEPTSAYGRILWTTRDYFVKGASVLRDSTGAPVGYIMVSGAAQFVRQVHVIHEALIITVGLVVGFAGLMIIIIHTLISGPTATLLKRVERLRSGRKVDSLSEGLRGEALVLSKRFERVLAHVEKLSSTDFLTNLWNRRTFERSLVREFYRARRYNRPLALMIMDVDHFKTTNDTFGHQVGDLMLQNLAEVLRQEVRSQDIATRFGGDEFAVLMPETDLSEAITVAQRSQQRLAERPIGKGELKVACTVSIGITDINARGINSPEEFVGLADQALYVAKRGGRNQIAVANEDVELLVGEEKQYDKLTRHATVVSSQDVRSRILFEKSMDSLIVALEMRDKLTKNHSANVCRYATLLAKRMHLPQHVVEEISYAAKLHDIGKISLPDSILLKEGELNEREWQLMKNHPIVGAKILEGIGILEHQIPTVRFHHERYDGKGYPDGLKGAAIPLGARILAVADAFDAMTSPRSYKDKMTVEKAVEELRHCKGSQFDPVVVDAFISLINEGHIKVEVEPLKTAV